MKIEDKKRKEKLVKIEDKKRKKRRLKIGTEDCRHKDSKRRLKREEFRRKRPYPG